MRETNQLYVGQSKDLKARFEDHAESTGIKFLREDSKFLHQAIASFTIQAFDYCILETFDSLSLTLTDELDKSEIHNIAKYRTFIDPWNYNLSEGGQNKGDSVSLDPIEIMYGV